MMSVNNRSSGFTLIELLVTVGVIGVLTSVAYPSYQEQVFKSKRATSTQSVLECAAMLERRFTLNSTFTSDACDDVNNDDYVITVAVSGQTRTNRACTSNGNENCFLITSTSSNASDTKCKTMTYNELGIKLAYKSDGSTLNTETCWRTT